MAPFFAAIGLIARSAADLRYATRDRLAQRFGDAAPARRLAIPAELALAVTVPSLPDPVLDAPLSVQVIGRVNADVALVDLACGIEQTDPFVTSGRLPR